MKEHEKGINSKYTKSKGFHRLEVFFQCSSRSRAMKLECFIKKQCRNKKFWIISNPHLFINELEYKDEVKVGVFK